RARARRRLRRPPGRRRVPGRAGVRPRRHPALARPGRRGHRPPPGPRRAPDGPGWVSRAAGPAPRPAAGTGSLDRVGLGLCLVSAAGFGSLAVFGKQAYAGGLGVAGVLAIRLLAAAPLLVGLALAARRSLRVGWPVA